MGTSDTGTPSVGETAPDFEALVCDGQTFAATTFDDQVDGGAVLVFFGFAFGPIAENWWKRYARLGWAEFEVPVLGVGRDGPYAQNRFLDVFDLPFALFADVEGEAAAAYDLLRRREGMGPTRTADRAVFVVDADRVVQYRWVAEDWLAPPSTDEIEAAVAEL